MKAEKVVKDEMVGMVVLVVKILKIVELLIFGSRIKISYKTILFDYTTNQCKGPNH